MSKTSLSLVAASTLFLLGCPVEIPVPVDPPDARLDYARTALNTPVTLAPLANDYDPNGEVLSVVSIGLPSHGSAVLNVDGTVDYTPDLGYLGGDRFDVTITDASGNEVTNSAVVTIGSSQRVLYRSNYLDYYTHQLYMADSAHPETPIPVNSHIGITVGPVLSRQQVSAYVPSTDGGFVLYVADDQPTVAVSNLFLVDLAQPGISTRLTDIQSGQSMDLFKAPQLSPDNAFAFYGSNEFNPAIFEVVRVEVANTANRVRINPPLATGDRIDRYSVTPDGNHLVYVANDADGGGVTGGQNEMFVVDLANPGVATKISGTATAGTGGVFGSTSGLAFRFVPNSTKVVYAGTFNGATTNDIYIVDYVALTPPQKLNGTLLEPSVRGFSFTPDGTRVLYVAAEDLATVSDLYMVSVAAPGTPTRLSKSRTGTALIGLFIAGLDSTFAVYTRDDDTADVRELYFVDFATPSVQVKLNHALRPAALPVPAEAVLNVRLSEGAPRLVLYSTNDSPVDGITNQTMRWVDVDAVGTTTVVGPSFGAGRSYGWMPDGDTIVYQDSPPESTQATALYMVTRSAPTVFTRLSLEALPGAAAVDFSFPP